MVLLAESSLDWSGHGLERLAAEHKRSRGVACCLSCCIDDHIMEEVGLKTAMITIAIKGGKRVRLDRKELLY
jgi:hypothetical protein